ncbi:MAG: non-homologous end-joining DNA ligase [Pyrinomonadaceae bacterium]
MPKIRDQKPKAESILAPDQLKRIPGARKIGIPEFVSPQLATLVKDAPTGNDWFHEVKFDGYRMLCHLRGGKVQFWSRNRNDWTARFPTLGKAIKNLDAASAILDGEVVAIDAAGRTSFQKLQQSIGKTGDASFVFQIFDLMYLNGFDLTRTPLRQRKALLAQLLESAKSRSRLHYSDHVEGNGPAFFKEACRHGVEGIVSKLADSPYESTRNRNWQKVKCIKRQEFVIAGYTPSEKGMPGFGSLVLGVYDKGKLLYAGRAGTGFTIKQRLELRKKLDPLVQDFSPFAVRPKDPGLRHAVWAEPKLVGEVAFTEWTDDGSVRHPSFQGLREDKKAKDVVREEPN